ncbi:MAG: sugar nucleotide-binding protein [Planctomycetes bacterium]|nr:sugar nucleotide-binding protein [Planctomycetota bacterium]
MPALRILVTGATGFLGGHAVAALRRRGHRVFTTGRGSGDAAVDLCAPGMVAAVLEASAPDLVLHLAAMSRVRDCEQDPRRARLVNVWLPQRFAERFGPRLLHVSTDLVFSGSAPPYEERDSVGPLSVYGCTKAEAEQVVHQHEARVVRLPLLFGPDAQGRGATASLRRAQANGVVSTLFTNEYRTPLHAADAAAVLADLLPDVDGPQLLHVSGPERCSRWELGRRLCALHDLDANLLVPAECQDALRPRDVSMRGSVPPRRSLDEMLMAS